MSAQFTYGNNYSYADIERYLAGKMPAIEMHAMEKAALHDPFLADAIEGFATAEVTQTKKHLNHINQLINNDKAPAKVVPLVMGNQRNNLTKGIAAAALLLLIVATWWLVSPTKKDVLPVTAANPTAPISDLKDSNNNNQPIANENGVVLIQPRKEAPQVTSISPNSTNNGLENKNSTSADKLFFFNNKDTSNQPIVAANEGTDTALNKPSLQKNNANTAMADTKAEAASSKRLDNVLAGRTAGLAIETEAKKDNTKETLDDVVVIGYGTSKKSKNKTNDSLATASLRSAVTGNEAMPAEGWSSFNSYMNKKVVELFDTTLNKNVVITDKNGNALDEIELEFSLDKKGAPYDIKVIDDIDEDKANTIATLVKQGPKWVGKRKRNRTKIVLNVP